MVKHLINLEYSTLISLSSARGFELNNSHMPADGSTSTNEKNSLVGSTSTRGSEEKIID